LTYLLCELSLLVRQGLSLCRAAKPALLELSEHRPQRRDCLPTDDVARLARGNEDVACPSGGDDVPRACKEQGCSGERQLGERSARRQRGRACQQARGQARRASAQPRPACARSATQREEAWISSELAGGSWVEKPKKAKGRSRSPLRTRTVPRQPGKGWCGSWRSTWRWVGYTAGWSGQL